MTQGVRGTGTVIVTCIRCGETLSRRQANERQRVRLGSPGPFCSRSCASFARRAPNLGPIEQTCRQCLTMFTKPMTSARAYCSAECAAFAQWGGLPGQPPMPAARLWSKVSISPSGCWTFAGSHLKAGYGAVHIGPGRYLQAHRLAWELLYGPIHTGLVVMHTCDNPPCVRPSHLRLGTHRENMQDMAAKGRHRDGPNATGLWRRKVVAA